jgi:hypothetical protein
LAWCETDLVDYFKNYREMAAPFQGIDDGLVGKIWPTLPRKDRGVAAQANGRLMPKNKTTLASSTED